MKDVITQQQRDDLTGKTVKALINGLTIEGKIIGRLLDFPLFVNDNGIRFEISWFLAKRAVEEGAIIKY